MSLIILFSHMLPLAIMLHKVGRQDDYQKNLLLDESVWVLQIPAPQIPPELKIDRKYLTRRSTPLKQ